MEHTIFFVGWRIGPNLIGITVWGYRKFFSRLLVSDVFSDVFSNGFRFPSKFVVKSSLGRSTRKLPSCHFRFHLIFKVILKIKFTVKRRGTGRRPEITSVPLPKWSETIVTLHEQLTQPWPLTWHWTFQVKIKVKRRGTGYRPEIKSVHIPKWSQRIASLPEQLTWP